VKALHPFTPKPGFGDYCGHIGDDGECGWPRADHQTTGSGKRRLIAMINPRDESGRMRPEEEVVDEMWQAIQAYNMEQAVEGIFADQPEGTENED
jgi:hypothetical protein